MDYKRINQLVFNSHAGVKRCSRILEYHRNHAADLLTVLRRTMRHIHALEQHLAGSRLLQAAHHIGSCGLAAAGLAYDPDSLSGKQLDVHLVDSLDLIRMEQLPCACSENNINIAQFNDRYLP